MEKARVKIEVVCDDCHGEGMVFTPAQQGETQYEKGVNCSGCDGTGYQVLYVNLQTLKHLLEGGAL